MTRWVWIAVLATFGMAGTASGADLIAPTATPIALAGQSVGAAEPTRLDWLRHVGPWTGRRVVASVGGKIYPTIEWRSRNEVRVRTESGASLAESERQAVVALALVCNRGEVRDPTTRVELTGTFVVEYDCARLQDQ